jgi:hypothetical protein
LPCNIGYLRELEDDQMAHDHKEKGSVGFYVSDSSPDWATNAKRYAFRAIKYGDVRVRATKNPDRTLSVIVAGAFGKSYDFLAPLNLLENGLGVHIGITWQQNEVMLYVNGVPIMSRVAPKAGATNRLIQNWGTFIGGRRSTTFSTS